MGGRSDRPEPTRRMTNGRRDPARHRNDLSGLGLACAPLLSESLVPISTPVPPTRSDHSSSRLVLGIDRPDKRLQLSIGSFRGLATDLTGHHRAPFGLILPIIHAEDRYG